MCGAAVHISKSIMVTNDRITSQDSLEQYKEAPSSVILIVLVYERTHTYMYAYIVVHVCSHKWFFL